MGLSINSGISIGKLRKGGRNLITDVPGVKVGHCTLKKGNARTGVTAVLPHEGNLFKEKVMAGACVINGFGKSLGLLQIDELGTIETPILMTNTLSVGTAAVALAKHTLMQNEDIGRETGTVNCVVTECNDGRLNDIRGMHVKEEHIFSAIEEADSHFEEGAAGAGTGMTCMDLKGGIGSASRIVTLDGKDYTVGGLVLANFGKCGDLVIDGDPVGARIAAVDNEPEKGSIIMLLATDIPLSDRQLRRAARRSVVGLSRTGSFLGNGSGDIAIAFSTANRIPHYNPTDIFSINIISDNSIDDIFRAVAESVEESIVSALYHADTTVGYSGDVRMGLREYLEPEKLKVLGR